jgi:glycosyltransferase involved in cell wall biosynthesis
VQRKELFLGESRSLNQQNRLVSIIVPVYNTPIRPLRRCITSLIKQSYTNIEIIIVDDGSNSSVLRIIESFTSGDNRIRLISGQHRGVSHARNLGIANAKGEWIAFVDSDDEALRTFVAEGMQIVADSNADFLCGGCQAIFLNSQRKSSEDNILYYQSVSQTEKKYLQHQMLGPFRDSRLDGPNFSGRGPWAKFYRTKLIRGLTFNEQLKISEDVLFNYNYIDRCETVVVTDRIWYWYYQYQGSALHTFDINSWDSSVVCMAHEMKKYDDRAAFLTRSAFMCFQAIENSSIELGVVKGFIAMRELLYKAQRLRCFSKFSFSNYVLSPWVNIMVILCRYRLFCLAYFFWSVKHGIKNVCVEQVLINESKPL